MNNYRYTPTQEVRRQPRRKATPYTVIEFTSTAEMTAWRRDFDTRVHKESTEKREKTRERAMTLYVNTPKSSSIKVYAFEEPKQTFFQRAKTWLANVWSRAFYVS